MQSWEYEKALSLISGEKSEDYYNRGVIKSMNAYTLASGTDFSWLMLAYNLTKSATQDFLLAQNLQTNKKLKTAIEKNITTAATLTLITNAKTCYVISTETIQHISWLQQQLDETYTLLQREKQEVQRSKAGQECKQTRLNEISQNQNNMLQLTNILDQEIQNQKELLQEKRKQPEICLQTQDTSPLINIQKTIQHIGEFSSQHTYTTTLRESRTSENLAQLCEAKNDAQINQSLQHTIDQLLASLQKETASNFQPSNVSSPQYVPLDKDQQKLLESVDKKNNIWIRQIQRLKSYPKYQWIDYLNTLFQEFYGNTGNFVQ